MAENGEYLLEEEEEEDEDEGVEGVGEGDEESTDSMVSASMLPSTFKPEIYSRNTIHDIILRKYPSFLFLSYFWHGNELKVGWIDEDS